MDEEKTWRMFYMWCFFIISSHSTCTNITPPSKTIKKQMGLEANGKTGRGSG